MTPSAAADTPRPTTSGRSPGPPLLSIWIPTSDPDSGRSDLATRTGSDAPDVEKSPLHATASYGRARSGSTTSGAWAHRLRARHGGGQGVLKRFLAAALLGVVLLWVCALAASPSPSPHTVKPPLRPTGDLREIDVSSDALPLDASLADRLAMWESAPGGRGAGEGVEMGDFVRWNLEQCENTWPNHNHDLMRKASNTWNTLNRSSIHDHRLDLINAVRDAERAGELAQVGAGRGIVFTAGNADTVQRVIWTLRVLRNVYESTLPALVFHFPSERLPENSPQLAELAELGAAMVEAQGTARDDGRTKSYHLKAIAMIQAPWREVLYLDSDNIPTRDPTYIFEAPNYKRLGAMFWPDYWKTNPTNPIWQIMGVKCRDEWEQEAGQIFIDKARHLDALVLSRYMLAHHDFWYMFSDGDKDIFRFAFLALRKRWAVPGRYVGAGCLPGRTVTGEFCGLTMQQYDHLGAPLFIHYNLLKQVPSGVGRGQSWGKTKQFPLFLDDAAARADNATSLRGIGDVDADMLADADDNGHARSPAAFEVRKRAAAERGIRPFFHGGTVSALCIDMRYDDPRPDEARAADAGAGLAPGENELGIDWADKNMLEVALWKDDDLLREFEAHVYAQGFVPNGKGF